MDMLRRLHPWRLLRLVPLLLAAAIAPAQSASAAMASEFFARGQQLYESRDFAAAAAAFAEAVRLAPGISRHHHWLGKSYGRLAERSPWLKALDYARKTCASLEQAVALDEYNVEAMRDLLKYYEQAPAILGGSSDRAQALRSRLEVLLESQDTRLARSSGSRPE
jgi:tetratricopeptide (TPR) repeat protein